MGFMPDAKMVVVVGRYLSLNRGLLVAAGLRLMVLTRPDIDGNWS